MFDFELVRAKVVSRGSMTLANKHHHQHLHIPWGSKRHGAPARATSADGDKRSISLTRWDEAICAKR